MLNQNLKKGFFSAKKRHQADTVDGLGLRTVGSCEFSDLDDFSSQTFVALCRNHFVMRLPRIMAWIDQSVGTVPRRILSREQTGY